MLIIKNGTLVNPAGKSGKLDIVIEDGKKHLGEETEVTVTTVLQTSAGRMVFARIK